LGYGITHGMIDRLTMSIFDLPKSVALENAFIFLGLPPSASNADVNKKYKELALKYHPDKRGGSQEMFHKLMVNVAVIKASREKQSDWQT
jgi:preprotein translocase subunit Sec63